MHSPDWKTWSTFVSLDNIRGFGVWVKVFSPVAQPVERGEEPLEPVNVASQRDLGEEGWHLALYRFGILMVIIGRYILLNGMGCRGRHSIGRVVEGCGQKGFRDRRVVYRGS